MCYLISPKKKLWHVDNTDLVKSIYCYTLYVILYTWVFSRVRMQSFFLVLSNCKRFWGTKHACGPPQHLIISAQNIAWYATDTDTWAEILHVFPGKHYKFLLHEYSPHRNGLTRLPVFSTNGWAQIWGDSSYPLLVPPLSLLSTSNNHFRRF